MDRKFLSASLFLPEIDTDEDSNHLEPPPVPPSLPDIENKDNNSNDLVGRNRKLDVKILNGADFDVVLLPDAE